MGWADYTSVPGTLQAVAEGTFMAQVKAVALCVVWTGVVSFVLFKLLDLTIGLRVSADQEREASTSPPTASALQLLTERAAGAIRSPPPSLSSRRHLAFPLSGSPRGGPFSLAGIRLGSPRSLQPGPYSRRAPAHSATRESTCYGEHEPPVRDAFSVGPGGSARMYVDRAFAVVHPARATRACFL